MIVEAAQVHILPVSKQPGDWRDGKGKDIKAILLNPQAFVLVHLERKFCGVSILNNGAILSKICTTVALLFNKCSCMDV